MNKKTKIILIAVSIIAIIAAVVIILTREVPSTTSASYEVVLDDVTVDNLRFVSGKITNNNLVVQVQNTTSTTYNLNYIDVTFKNGNNNIITISGYIGESLESNEIRNLNIKTDVDLSNTNNVLYSVIK